MASSRMIAVLLVVFATGQQHLVDSGLIETTRGELSRKIDRLDAALEEVMRTTFYDKKREAEALGDIQMLQLVARIGQLELLQYRRERRALMIVDDIIKKHFVTAASSSNDWPPKTESLADLISSRVIQRACESEIASEQAIRKDIFSLFFTYDGDRHHVEKYAFQHCLRIKDKEVRAVKAQRVAEQALTKFQQEVAGRYPDEQVSNLLGLVDELIVQAESRHGSAEEPVESVRQVASDVESVELIAFREPLVAEPVSMDEAAQRVASYVDLFANEVFRAIYEEETTLEVEFEETILDIFHGQVEEAEANATINYPLKAIAARMAECESVMYASENTMKAILRRLITQYLVERSREFEEPLIENSNLIKLIWRRSIGLGLKYGLHETIGLRKEIYIILKRFEGQAHLGRLARRFYEILKDKERRQVETYSISQKILSRYINDALFVLADTQEQGIMRAVDRLLNRAKTEGNAELLQEIDPEEFPSHRQFIGDDLFDEIMTAKRGYEVEQNEIDLILMRDLTAFEDSWIKTPPDSSSSE